MDKRLKLIFIFIVAIIGIAVLFFIPKEEKEGAGKTDELRPENKLTYVDDVDTSGWNLYANSQLGFSIKIPSQVSGVNRCEHSDFLVPVTVFSEEGNNSVYIVPEYYYDRDSESGSCKKITYSLDLLINPEKSGSIFFARAFIGWRVVVIEVNNLEEVNKFIGDNFGKACVVGSQTLNDKGFYEIGIIGSDWDTVGRIDSTCFWELHYKILYSPEKHRLLSIRQGPDYDFFVQNPGGMINYDKEMLESIDFQ